MSQYFNRHWIKQGLFRIPTTNFIEPVKPTFWGLAPFSGLELGVVNPLFLGGGVVCLPCFIQGMHFSQSKMHFYLI